MRQTGTIQFRVFTSGANLPVEDATVIIRQQNAPFQLLGILVTDRSGQTPVLTVDAQAAGQSQTPEPGPQPWISLRAYVEHPDYEEAAFTGLQLFPGVKTIQNVQLIPNQLVDMEENDLQEFETTPQPISEDSP